jgi:hypothetical protein
MANDDGPAEIFCTTAEEVLAEFTKALHQRESR